MVKLSELKDTTRHKQKVKRVGRGNGSGYGKTAARGCNGDGSRSGYRTRRGYEGGQARFYLKLPIRGPKVSARFSTKPFTLNLWEIDELYNEGDTVSPATVLEKRLASKSTMGFANQANFEKNIFHTKHHGRGLKILGQGELSKKVTIQAHSISKGAEQKLKSAGVSYSVIK